MMPVDQCKDHTIPFESLELVVGRSCGAVWQIDSYKCLVGWRLFYSEDLCATTVLTFIVKQSYKNNTKEEPNFSFP